MSNLPTPSSTIPTADPEAVLACRKCGAQLGTITDSGVAVGGIFLQKAFAYKCIACGYIREWRPARLKIERISA